MTFTATSISAMQTSAKTAVARRDAKKPRKRSGSAISLGLFEVDQDRIGGKEGDDDRQEIDEVAHIDDAPGYRAEMAEKTHLSDAADQPFRRPALKESEHDRRARDGKDEDESGSDDKGNDLVLRHRRDTGPDRQHGARHQPAAEIARQDHAVIRMAEKIDRDPEREGQSERNTGKTPGSEEFSDDGFGHADRQRQKQLDRAAPALLRPQPHRQGRDQDDIEPGMEVEEGLEIGLPALEEIADKERQSSRHHEKDDDEHIGQRGREVPSQLAAENREGAVHRDQAAAAAIAEGRSGAVVISRKTSSSRPRSTRNEVIIQPRSRAQSAISATMGRPSRGKITSPSPSGSETGSTAATPGNAASSARLVASMPPAILTRTALW